MNWWYSLLSVLPFEWAQPGSMMFFKNALLAIVVIAPLFGILSTMVVTNKMSFFSDALGHSAFTGMVIGAAAGLLDPMYCAVIFAVVFSLLYALIRRKSNIASDTVIGVFSSTAVALGIFLATLGGRSFSKFNTYLIGDILSVSPGEILVLFIVLVCIIVLWLISFNSMMLSSVHPALADSRGIKVFWQTTAFSAAIAVVVTLALNWVGLLVINSLLVLPAAAARNVAKNMSGCHILAIVFAFIAGLLGLFISYAIGVSAGAAISLVLALIFALTFILRKTV